MSGVPRAGRVVNLCQPSMLALRPFGPFSCNLEPTKAICPHVVDEFPHVGQSFWTGLEQSELAGRAHRDQPGVVEHLEMLGDGRSGDLGKLLSNLPGGALVVSDETQNHPTGPVAQRTGNSVERPQPRGWKWRVHVSDILHELHPFLRRPSWISFLPSPKPSTTPTV